MKCGDCKNRKEMIVGMDCNGEEKTENICCVQPLASEKIIDPKTNEPYGYEKLYSQHLKKCSPKWCPLKKCQ